MTSSLRQSSQYWYSLDGSVASGCDEKVEKLACVVSSQELGASLLGNLEEGQSKAAALLSSPLTAEVLSGFCLGLKPGVINTCTISAPTAEKHLPFPPLAEIDLGITGCLNCSSN